MTVQASYSGDPTGGADASHRTIIAAAAAMAAGVAAPAIAKDDAPCAADMVCASAPTTVAARMMRAGYQALIAKDQTGDQKIESAASGYRYQVYFRDCVKNVACDALQFYASF